MDIPTKYSLGDEVWFMWDNRPKRRFISQVTVTVPSRLEEQVVGGEVHVTNGPFSGRQETRVGGERIMRPVGAPVTRVVYTVRELVDERAGSVVWGTVDRLFDEVDLHPSAESLPASLFASRETAGVAE